MRFEPRTAQWMMLAINHCAIKYILVTKALDQELECFLIGLEVKARLSGKYDVLMGP